MGTEKDLSCSDVSILSSWSVNSATAVAVDCICLPAVSHRNSCSLTCVCCAKKTLLACFLHEFSQSGNGAFRNSVEWLHTFITGCNFQFTCRSCLHDSRDDPRSHSGNSASSITGNSHSEVSFLASCVGDLFSRIDVKGIKIEKLQSDLIKLPLIPTACEPIKCLSSVNQNTIGDYNSTVLHEPKLSSQISYAQTLSKNISDDLGKMVKQVVSDSLRAQKREDKIGVSVIIFGMPESDNDVTIVRKLLEDDDVIDSIVSITSLSKQHASERKKMRKVGLL